MSNYTIYQHISMGAPVYESETGPIIGYDNVQTNFFVVSDKAIESGLGLDDLADPEDTRIMNAVLRDVSRQELEKLRNQIDAALEATA